MSCLVKFGDVNAVSKMSVLFVLLPDACVYHHSNKLVSDDFEYF